MKFLILSVLVLCIVFYNVQSYEVLQAPKSKVLKKAPNAPAALSQKSDNSTAKAKKLKAKIVLLEKEEKQLKKDIKLLEAEKSKAKGHDIKALGKKLRKQEKLLKKLSQKLAKLRKELKALTKKNSSKENVQKVKK